MTHNDIMTKLAKLKAAHDIQATHYRHHMENYRKDNDEATALLFKELFHREVSAADAVEESVAVLFGMSALDFLGTKKYKAWNDLYWSARLALRAEEKA